MTANERLAEIKARAENTTSPGPWEHREADALPPGLGNVYPAEGIYPLIGCGHCGENDAAYETGDATFIAHARTDVPALVAALEAVLELHQPHPQWRLSWEGGQVCERCSHGDTMEAWPCVEVEAINEALGVDQP